MFRTIRQNVSETVSKKVKETTMYAVFEKETDKFLGVGDFTNEEVNNMQNKYVFSKM